MGEAILLLSPRKTRKPSPITKKTPAPGVKMTSSSSAEENKCSMLACFCSEKKTEDSNSADADKMDKVEFAFRKFDADGDGFLSWEEFQQVGMLLFVRPSIPNLFRAPNHQILKVLSAMMVLCICS